MSGFPNDILNRSLASPFATVEGNGFDHNHGQKDQNNFKFNL
jgi:hypothetical protein